MADAKAKPARKSALRPSDRTARPSNPRYMTAKSSALKPDTSARDGRPSSRTDTRSDSRGDSSSIARPTTRPSTRSTVRSADRTIPAKPSAARSKSSPADAKKRAAAPKFTRENRPGKSVEAVAEKELLPTVVVHMTITANEDGQRVDNYLMKCLPGVPKSHIYLILRSGQVRVDGGRVKPDRKLAIGEEVRIPPVRLAEKAEQVRAPDAVLNRLREAIVYEDEHYLAICKPAGLASHGGTGIAYGVIEAARGWGKYDFLELAHRLDRDTSGVLLLAKSRVGLLRAQRAFREGLADKRYFALIVGRLQGGARDVDAALVKKSIPGGERYIGIDEEDGKPSKSRFVPQAHYKDATLCEVHIYSGRTHQIRVHALALGHPVAGDRKYGLRDDQKPIRDLGLRRMFLHSHFLQLPADGDFGKLILNAPMTEELRDFLQVLGPGR